ncbi:MAG: DUF1015 domain-containing protein, partial [Candidatus Thiodiazotropha sp. (ex Rostrolucina anterorostrata)]|nr:DUF1015 domain-containing protein [Candidatus Thiodiazotropha sp. (ex Rostrolucina anterorostrata)]
AGVVSPPYDIISEKERERLASLNPHNVVRLILPYRVGVITSSIEWLY